jgi:hypothetical protein
MADFNMGLLGDLFGGGTSALSEYLTPQQQESMQRQALLSTAAALLQAGGPSATPISLGQALGAGLQAGTSSYGKAQEGAIQQLLVRQKLDEAKRAQAAQEAYQKFILGQPGQAQTITPEQAIAMPGMPVGPTVERAAMIGQEIQPSAMQPGAMPGNAALTPQMRQLLAGLPAEKGIPEMLKFMQPQEVMGSPFRGADGKYYLQTKTGGVIPAPVAPDVKPTGQPQEAMVNGTPTLVQYYEDGSYKVVTGVSPKAEASPTEVRLLQAANMPVTMENIMAIRRSGASNVNVDVGQKGFENKMSAKKTFMSEPIYKDFNDMKSAYGQVLTSLDQGTPIGDVAGATKVMKLLDPGSVVRESELGIAMAASGRMDRLQNYFTLWASGNKLTPTQRADFRQLSNELYAAAGQAYNQKRGEYIDFGESTGVTLDKALGGPANIPSIMRVPGGAPGTSPAGQPRRSLSEIFTR